MSNGCIIAAGVVTFKYLLSILFLSWYCS